MARSRRERLSGGRWQERLFSRVNSLSTAKRPREKKKKSTAYACAEKQKDVRAAFTSTTCFHVNNIKKSAGKHYGRGVRHGATTMIGITPAGYTLQRYMPIRFQIADSTHTAARHNDQASVWRTLCLVYYGGAKHRALCYYSSAKRLRVFSTAPVEPRQQLQKTSNISST